MRTTLLILSDFHAGHKLGLCPPDIELYDESPDGQLIPFTPELTAFQQMLWLHLTETILTRANEVAGDDPLYLFLLGDPTHGNRHPEQLMTTRAADQIVIAQATSEAIIERLPGVLLVRSAVGTGSHEFGEASASILVGNALARAHPDLDIRTLYHGYADVNGVNIDYAHHGPTAGRRVWLYGNEARFYLRDIMLRSILAGQRPPDLVLRGHIHQLVSVTEGVWAGNRMHSSRLVICPSMCGLSDYARQVTRSAGGIVIGGVIIVVENGHARDPEYVTLSWDLRTKERL